MLSYILTSIAHNKEKIAPEAPKIIVKNILELIWLVKKGEIRPAVAHATAKFVKKSENIFSTN